MIKRYLQQKRVDYDKTYLPVFHNGSFLLSQCSSEIEQMDTVQGGDLHGTAFILCEPEKCMTITEGFYGLKQSSWFWDHKLDADLKGYGLTRSTSDSCVYYKMNSVKHYRYKSEAVLLADVANADWASNTDDQNQLLHGSRRIREYPGAQNVSVHCDFTIV